MIDFRYHLVSIIAVFFALAVGIVLGAGPLGERLDADLPEQLAASRERSQELQEQIRELEAHQEFRDGFVDAVSAELVSDRLRDDVAIVALPGADDTVVSAVEELFTLAGATITSTVQVEQEWTEPEAEAALDALAAQLVSSGTVLPESGNGFDRGGALLAGALLRPPPDESLALTNGLEEGTGQPASAAVDEDVLIGLSEANFISVDGEAERKARLAVVIAGPAPETEETEDGGEAEGVVPDAYLGIVDALEQAGSGVVVASASAVEESTGVVALVRADVELNDRVSTVDSIVLPGGRVALVYAAAEQLSGGTGQYGNVGAEDGLLPPVPIRAGAQVPGGDVDDGTDASTDGEDEAGEDDAGEDEAGDDEDGGE